MTYDGKFLRQNYRIDTLNPLFLLVSYFLRRNNLESNLYKFILALEIPIC